MKKIYSVIVLVFLTVFVFSQLKINESSYRNFTQLTDDFNDNPDWIELYNTGNEALSLQTYYLSDSRDDLKKWRFPAVSLPAHSWQLVYASGRNTEGSGIDHWETAVREDMNWNWKVPDASTPEIWKNRDFDDSGWAAGPGGFGFADDDDNTVLQTTDIAVYTRIHFTAQDTSKLEAAMLHVDFDDGFVAYLNGTEIARSNISTALAWNSFADNATEALMYQGQNPTEFILTDELWKPYLKQGDNVLAVECHNASTTSSDISLRVFLSFGLTDETSQFESTPGWFNLNGTNGLHTNFKISSKGETIYLSNTQGVITDSLVLPSYLPVDYSYGCATDGSAEKGYFATATPNSTNNSQTAFTQGTEPTPLASYAGGIYPDRISVSLSTPSTTAQIRYTLNGEKPTSTSTLYTGAISINSTKVLKAACFSTAQKLPSPVVTNTYFIGLDATPAGILSITINNNDLYGSTGIYENWWTDWKKPCYIEFYKPDNHNLAFKQNAGIKIDGGAGGSRSNEQKSFRVEPGNGTLGDGDVQYKLIPSKPDRENFETFYIRNGSNQYLYYPCKDAIETRCMGEETHTTYSGYTPVQVYLNGQYWGYYELREKLDEDFFKQYFGTNEDSLEVLSVSYWYGGQLRAVTGIDPVTRFNSDYDTFLSLNTSDENYWAKADSLFDMESYVDYICAQTWIADTDWPFNNIRIHRSPESNYRWRFSLIDLEWSLNPNGWTNSYTDHLSYMRYYDNSYPYIHIWQKAMENNQFHDYFINRLADLMNTTWHTNRLKAVANEVYTETRPELPATFERWVNESSVDAYMNQFDAAHSTMISELSQRSTNVRNHVVSNFGLPKKVTITLKVEPAESGYIQISTITPETYPWTGTYFDGIPVTLKAKAKTGFVFSHWDQNALLTAINEAVFTDTLNQSLTFTAHFVENTTDGLVTISEINYHSESSIDAGDWIEFWNFSNTMPIDLTGWYLTDEDPLHVYEFPANTIIEPNDRLVVVRDEDNFTDQFSRIDYLTGLSFGLGNSGDALKLYDKNQVLVNELMFTDGSPWPKGADGQGYTLELQDPHNPLKNAENWFNGCLGGSPGSAFSNCDQQIVFSEINYNSTEAFNTGDWVELRNISNATADLSGWFFRDDSDSTGHSYTLPQGTLLEPHQNLLLVQDETLFNSIDATVSNTLGSFNFGLSNSGEWIRAYDKTGVLQLSVRFNDSYPWPLLANGQGYTLELADSTGLMNDGENWFAGCYGGSPGRYYSNPCDPVVSVTEKTLQNLVTYPNPFNNQFTVETSANNQVVYRLYHFTGKLVFTTISEEQTTTFNFSHLPGGIYLLTASFSDGTHQTLKMIKK